MILFTLILLYRSVLTVLIIIHFYWAVGGTWRFANALPTNEVGERVLNPRKIDSAIIGTGLGLFLFYFLIYGQIIKVALHDWLMEYGVLTISGIFLLRAIGDFKYVGFFSFNWHTNNTTSLEINQPIIC